MKITESRIRRIIREELLREFSRTPTPSEIRAAANAVRSFNIATSAKSVTPAGLAAQLLAAVGVEVALWFLNSDYAKKMLSPEDIEDTINEVESTPADSIKPTTRKNVEDIEDDDDVYVKIEEYGSKGKVRITVYKKSGDTFVDIYQPAPNKDQELATIIVGSLSRNLANRGGPCLGSWEVKWSKASPGWGPLVYDIAIEVSSILASGLASDTSGVSPSAKKVWDTYLKKGSLATSPGTSLQVSDLDDAYTKFITPSNTSDDCERVPVRTHYPSYVGVPNSYWDTSVPFDKDLPNANMAHEFGDPPEGTQSPKRFTKDFEEFYRGTGITKMFSVNGHPTIDRLKASGNLEITHPELSYLV